MNARICCRYLQILLCCVVLPAALCAQNGDTAVRPMRDGDMDTLRRPFTENAQKYYIPAYPQYWVGLGICFVGPDLASVDEGFLSTERPSENTPSPGFYAAVRVQISLHASATVSLMTHEHGSATGFQRYAVEVCGHLPFGRFIPSNVFLGVGVAHLRYAHDGSTGGETRIRINALRNAVQVLGGVNLIVPGGPGLTVAAGYQFVAEERDLDLSMPYAHASIMF